ncbi:MAG: DNA mismatch repair protein MutS [marine benthic group bacterium]|nr:DNA mismatch repair protein MutS [Gemmatimonadota bacterium]
MTGATKHTPLIQQYLDVKAKHPDCILFFRVGDFYEMFFEDAQEGSRLLGITLTSRNNGSSDVPLAGVPVKALPEYLPRMVRAGRRVAICEQVEDAAGAEGLVRREVVEIVTPGASIDDVLLDGGRNNFVAAVAGENPLGIATADLSTGEVEVWECHPEALGDELSRIEPAELVVRSSAAAPDGPWIVTRREPWRFEADVGAEALRRVYRTSGIDGFGFELPADRHLVAAAGAMAAYLEELRPAGVDHLRAPRLNRIGRHLHLDEMTRRNLEIVEPLRTGEGGTLVEVLDRTRTPMGRRLLRRRVLRPLVDRASIERRLDAVQELAEDRDRRADLRSALGDIRDLERLATRVALGRISPREMLGLGRSLEPLPAVAEVLSSASAPRMREIRQDFDDLGDLREQIESAIDPDTPATLAAGGVIRTGFDARLDELREVRDEAVNWIARLQARERENTGIDSLKVGYNKVFGYYIEVTRSNLGRVPDRYDRKQTLANAERFITPELKEWEAKVFDAEARIAESEAELFRTLREDLATHVSRVQATAERIAELDVHASFAETAERDDYVRPELSDDFGLEIVGGRHPVVERRIAREEFIPNDCRLDRDGYVMILTGPNMAGKSTFLRQVGLIALMAQVGSYVPADAARIGLCDRVFTRVGASDSLARGQSTFMVEMTETATILNGATDRSLVLLDEIGRGTSTYDGVAIAWAVTEHIHEQLGARTVFATHYHELVELADSLSGVEAWNVAVRETGDDIVFLRRLEPGGCDRSYGVHVARLAGVPRPVIDRAFEVLHELEDGPAGGTRLAHLVDRGRNQLSLFGGTDPVLARKIAAVDVDRLTPLDALLLVSEWKTLLEEEQ